MAVREVHLRAFEDRGEEALLVELLYTARAAVVSLVAAADPAGRIVGHILFSPVQVDGRGSDPPIMVGLAPVAVLPEHQGRGIGAHLIREGLQACREAGYGAAVVLGEPGYYSRFGFEQASGKDLGNEYSVDDHFMVAELATAWALCSLRLLTASSRLHSDWKVTTGAPSASVPPGSRPLSPMVSPLASTSAHDPSSLCIESPKVSR
jgi:putative acetyltransferase